MKNWLRGLSTKSELAIVVVLALACPIVLSTLDLLNPDHTARFTDANMCFLIFYELAALGLVSWVLIVRGWKLSAFNLDFSTGTLLTGGALALASYFLYAIVYVSLASVLPAEMAGRAPEVEVSNVSPVIVLATSIVNATFEEVIVVGYIFAALGISQSSHFLVNFSVALRVSYHLYQGPVGAVGVAAIGLVFALYYVRYKRLGPLIVAHSVMDIVGLLLRSQ